MRNIDLYIVTGFLGSGKTTLMKDLISNFRDKKLGVIVNDFGSLNADAKTLESEFSDILEVTNGSLFCSCKSHRFIDTLVELSHKDIDVVIVESSGLADVSTLYTVLDMISKIDNDYYTFKGSICIVDAGNIHKVVETAFVIKSQIYYSDLILLNKTDLVNEETLLKAVEIVRMHSQTTEIIPTSFSKVDFSKLTKMNHKRRGKIPNIKIDINTQSETVVFDKETNKDILTFIDAVKDDCNRIKGFLNNTDQLFIEYVEGLITINKFEYHGIPYVVFLTVKQTDLMKSVIKHFYQVFGYQPKFKKKTLQM